MNEFVDDKAGLVKEGPETSRRLGAELGGGAYNAAKYDLRDRGNLLPFSKFISDSELRPAFEEGVVDGVNENVAFDLKKLGLNQETIDAGTNEITEAYINFVKSLQKYGLGFPNP